MKVVINRCYGGFGLSDKAYERLIELGIPVKGYKKGLDNTENKGKIIFDNTLSNVKSLLSNRYWDAWIADDRTNPLLIQIVEELKDEVHRRFANLVIVEVPDDVKWYIDEYDGYEHIAENHRTWS